MSKVILIDGGFATQLRKHVKSDFNEHPLWGTQYLQTDPEAVINTHRDFVRAGADVILTNTYQADVESFKNHLGLSTSESYNLIKKSVSYCEDAIQTEKRLNTIDENKNVLIAGSVGPFGASLRDGSEYRGDYITKYDIRHIEEWHRPRIEALIEGGVDLLALETIPCLKEAEMLVKLLREYPNQKAWLSFSCKDDIHISYGERFDEVARKCWSLNSTQLVAIGVNCVKPNSATNIIKSLTDKTIPTIVYPNSGETWDAVNKVWIKDHCSELESKLIDQWCKMKIKYIGGCCNIEERDIQFYRNIIDKFNNNQHVLN